MQPITITRARHPVLRFLFDDAAVYSTLGEEISFGEIARRLEELPPGAYGDLLSIDVSLLPTAPAAPSQGSIR